MLHYGRIRYVTVAEIVTLYRWPTPAAVHRIAYKHGWHRVTDSHSRKQALYAAVDVADTMTELTERRSLTAQRRREIIDLSWDALSA